MEALWGEMTVFQDHLYNDPAEGFFSAKPTHSHVVFTLWVYNTNPPPPVPPFLLTLNQSPKEIAGSDITNCLTHTVYAKALNFKVACELCRRWSFELILSRAETYHVFLKTILFRYFLIGIMFLGGKLLLYQGCFANQKLKTEPETLFTISTKL